MPEGPDLPYSAAPAASFNLTAAGNGAMDPLRHAGSPWRAVPEQHRWAAAMKTDNDLSKPATRPVFRFLAGFLGVLFLLVGCLTGSFVFGSTGSVWWRWVVETAMFLFFGIAFIYAAFTGRWLRKS